MDELKTLQDLLETREEPIEWKFRELAFVPLAECDVFGEKPDLSDIFKNPQATYTPLERAELEFLRVFHSWLSRHANSKLNGGRVNSVWINDLGNRIPIEMIHLESTENKNIFGKPFLPAGPSFSEPVLVFKIKGARPLYGEFIRRLISAAQCELDVTPPDFDLSPDRLARLSSSSIARLCEFAISAADRVAYTDGLGKGYSLGSEIISGSRRPYSWKTKESPEGNYMIRIVHTPEKNNARAENTLLVHQELPYNPQRTTIQDAKLDVIISSCGRISFAYTAKKFNKSWADPEVTVSYSASDFTNIPPAVLERTIGSPTRFLKAFCDESVVSDTSPIGYVNAQLQK